MIGDDQQCCASNLGSGGEEDVLVGQKKRAVCLTSNGKHKCKITLYTSGRTQKYKSFFLPCYEKINTFSTFLAG